MIKFFAGSMLCAMALAGGCAQDSSYSARSNPSGSQPEAYARVNEEQPAKDRSPADMSAMMSKMEELGKIGEHHAILNQFVGNWECQTKTWCPMQTEPVESRGTMNVKQLHGGRFIQGDYAGNVPMPGSDGKVKEVPFTGSWVIGYSNADGEYQSTWTDSMSTAIHWMTGTAGTDAATVTTSGACKGPDESGNLVRRTSTQKFKKVSADKFVSEFWDEAAGSPKKKAMEITFTRIPGMLP